MATTTLKNWLKHFINKYGTKDDFKQSLDQVISELTVENDMPNALAFYKRLRNKLKKIEARLEELRIEIQAERISYGEIAELEELTCFIDPNDVELLQWANVEEN